MIWDSSHKYHFFMRREIFTVIFPRCKSPSYRWISPENYPYYGENTFSKKKLQLRKNYGSYTRILQSVPIILKHTLRPLSGPRLACHFTNLHFGFADNGPKDGWRLHIWTSFRLDITREEAVNRQSWPFQGFWRILAKKDPKTHLNRCFKKNTWGGFCPKLVDIIVAMLQSYFEFF